MKSRIKFGVAQALIVGLGVIVVNADTSASAFPVTGGSTVAKVAMMTCFQEVYTPDHVTADGVRYLAFGGKQICQIPHEQTVCVRPEERVNGTWIKRADFQCRTAVGFDVAKNITYRCSDLTAGRYRTKARFTDAALQVVTKSSPGVDRCG